MGEVMTFQISGKAYDVPNEFSLSRFLRAYREYPINPLACWHWRIA